MSQDIISECLISLLLFDHACHPGQKGLTVGQSLNINGKNYNLPTSIKECLGENYTPITYQTYTVKSGDNLYEIAKQYDTTVDNLIELNDLNSINLDIGQVLKIKENN